LEDTWNSNPVTEKTEILDILIAELLSRRGVPPDEAVDRLLIANDPLLGKLTSKTNGLLIRLLLETAGHYARLGKGNLADNTYERFLLLSEEALSVPKITYYEACYLALRGKSQDALLRLSEGVTNDILANAANDPDLQALRGNSEFEAIVAAARERLEVN